MEFKIDIYSDGAVIEDMLKTRDLGVVTGFTTNPSLMKKAGITNYLAFTKEVLNEIEDMPISFEVFGDEFDVMEKEAEALSALGSNVFVKIPITNTRGESSIPLIKRLSDKGINCNVTAILTEKQVRETVEAFNPKTQNIVSVFAGRIADTGVDPIPLMTKSVEICHEKEGVKLLWASTRELLNIMQAENLGVDIITVTPDILAKLSMYHMDLEELSLQTVKMFNDDVKELGFSILE